MNLLFCTIVGLVVGGLAAWWPQGYERHRTMDLVMGAAGGFAGGILVIVTIYGAVIFSGLSAALGAAVLILASRYVGGTRESHATLSRTFRMNRSKSARVIALIPAPVAYVPGRKR